MNQVLRFSFPKTIRLHSEYEIQKLFQSKQAFLVFPFRVLWQIEDSLKSPMSILISIPKAKIKSAVVRNRIRRRTREAIRLHQHQLSSQLSTSNYKLTFALIWVHHESLESKKIHDSVYKVLEKFQSILSATNLAAPLP
jgi:ribonuclease P protein component